MGRISGKDVYENYRGLDLAGHLALLIVNCIGVVGTYYLWTRRKHLAISTRRPKLILMNVVVNLFFDLTWSLDELFVLRTNGLPCVYREIKDSIYYLLVNEVLLLRSAVLYMTFNKTVYAQKALATKKATKNPDFVVTPKGDEGRISGAAGAGGMLSRMSNSVFKQTLTGSIDMGEDAKIPPLRSETSSNAPRPLTTLEMQSSNNVLEGSKADRSTALSVGSDDSMQSPSPQKPLVSPVPRRTNSLFEQSMGGSQLAEALQSEFSSAQIERLRKLQYLGSTRFLILLVLVTVGLYVAPYVFHWILNPDLFDLQFLESPNGTCFDSNVYRSLFILQFVYALGSLVILISVRIKDDIFGLKSELILLALYWIYFTVSQNAVYAALFYHPIVAVWQWAGNRLIFYVMFSYRPLFFLMHENPLKWAKWKKQERDSIDQNNELPSDFEPTTGALKEVLQDHKGFELFKEYLASEFCSESLLFWREAQDYKKACSHARMAITSNHPANYEKYHNKAKALAKKIVELYLTKDSAFQVNLSSQQLANFSKPWANIAASATMDINMFAEAEEEVLLMMTHGPFPRFIKTKPFLEFKISATSAKKSELAMISLVPMSELVPQQD
jgi:hypothetical protein